MKWIVITVWLVVFFGAGLFLGKRKGFEDGRTVKLRAVCDLIDKACLDGMARYDFHGNKILQVYSHGEWVDIVRDSNCDDATLTIQDCNSVATFKLADGEDLVITGDDNWEGSTNDSLVFDNDGTIEIDWTPQPQVFSFIYDDVNGFQEQWSNIHFEIADKTYSFTPEEFLIKLGIVEEKEK